MKCNNGSEILSQKEQCKSGSLNILNYYMLLECQLKIYFKGFKSWSSILTF